MKRRIEQLLNGIFEYEQTRLVIRPEKLQLHAGPEAVLHGSFQFEGEDHSKVRGFLYTSSPRMICSPVEFQGTVNEIQYQIDCSGLSGGDTLEGEITVCSDCGEYAVPYEVVIDAGESEPESLPYAGFEDFVQAAQENFLNAYRHFASPEFGQFLEQKRPELGGLYGAFGAAAARPQAMEEFLAAAGAKEALRFEVQQEEFVLKDVSEPVRETLQISRNTWGYAQISVDSDASFLRPEKKTVTAEDFAGSTFDLNFVLDANLMHAGVNYGRLTLTAGIQRIEVTVKAHKAGNDSRGRQHHICKIMMKEMEALYVGFRLKKIDISTWVERSVSVLNSYKRAGGKDPFADLFLVQLYFADGKKQKAYRILESFDSARYRLNTPERYAFYLYLTTFFYHEASYVDRVEEEIARMFYRDKTNWKLQWILLYLQEAYLNDEKARYEAVAEQFRYGCRSRIMYLEAYQVLKKNPFLMRHLGQYELRLLNFAAKEEVLTAEVIRQTSGLAAHYEGFDQKLYEILAAGYRLYPSSDLVKSICVLLMRGGKKDARYFPWYEKGVESGLRVTGLYEYYMETMENLDMQRMPQVIRMYFAYDTSLDYRRRAAIYRRIIENREEDPQTYRNYRADIEKFALDQLGSGRISEDLAVIYRAFLRRSMITRSMAERLARILCTQEICCDIPEACRIVVHSGYLKEEQNVLLRDKKALVPVYDPGSILMTENADGSRHLAEAVCTLRPVLRDSDMFSWCAELAADFPGLVLNICIGCLQENLVNRQTVSYYRAACAMPELSDPFRKRLQKEILQYYVSHLRDESLQEFLESIDYMEYVKVDKASLITLLAEEGKCTEAFTLLDACGAEGIELLKLVRICSRMVLELEFGENTMLTALCHCCFECGKYDDKLLRYLLLYYEGPVRKMEQIWRAAMQFDLDTMVLEEKIIMMMLFTRSGTQGSEPVFEAYLERMGRKKLCRAYVNLKCYEYFVKGLPVADSVFQFVEREYQYLTRKGRIEDQEEVCRLALLQYYAKAVELKPEQRERASRMLEEFSAKGMRFDFWQRFDAELLQPYQMEGRVFVEYACNPKSRVGLSCRIKGRDDSFTKEDVKNYFEGIFVREFTLFSGEVLECYLEEELDGQVIKTDKRVLRAAPSKMDGSTRYAMLDRISRAQAEESPELAGELESYLTTERLAREIFTLV